MLRPAHVTAMTLGLALSLGAGALAPVSRALGDETEPVVEPPEQFQPRVVEGYPDWYIERLAAVARLVQLLTPLSLLGEHAASPASSRPRSLTVRLPPLLFFCRCDVFFLVVRSVESDGIERQPSGRNDGGGAVRGQVVQVDLVRCAH